MSIDTYQELKDEIENHLDRDENIDTFIDLCEARMERDVRIREMLSRVTATYSEATGDDVDERYLDLPSGFLQMRTLRILKPTDKDLTNYRITVLEEVNLHEINRVHNNTKGKPEYFTVHGEIEFNREADRDYTVEMIFWKRIPALSSSNTTNAILDRAPDLYLYGSLLAAEPFLYNDERLPTWEKLYISARDRINKMDMRQAGPLVSRVSGPTP